MNFKFFALIAASFGCICAMGLSAQTYPYQDTTLSFNERAHDLLERLTIEEKTMLMVNSSPAIERLGIKAFDWWSEGLHGISQTKGATVFPVPIAMASSWDVPLVFEVYEAVSTEARARFNHYRALGQAKRHQGASIWTPNINIFRDPRWGRAQETWGEDPWYSGLMGTTVVKALQGPEDAKYRRIYACAKHFAVHSGPESSRHKLNIEALPARDLYETYLPAFKEVVQRGEVREVMCAYQRFEGEPCCGSKKLLQQILRDLWGYKYLVVSDCGAISDFYNKSKHHVVETAKEASAKAVGSGTDLECGGNYRKALPIALKEGLISEAKIDTSVLRLLRGRFEMGEMDPQNEWSAIPYSVIGCQEHADIADRITHESMVLLKNRNGILPISKEKKMTIAVIGPNANDSVMQWGDKNYCGKPRHTVTLLEGVRKAFPKATIIYKPVCSISGDSVTLSLTDQCTASGIPGFDAVYWNNTDMKGQPVANEHITGPFNLTASGGHRYASGVAGSRFSACYTATFTPETSGNAVFRVLCGDTVTISIDGRQVVKAPRQKYITNLYTLSYEKGKTYDIVITLRQYGAESDLRLDLVDMLPVDTARMAADVKDADYVVYAGGITPLMEGEGGDRLDIELPQIQRQVLAALHNQAKKVIYVNFSGSVIGFDGDDDLCDAILLAWYPGQAGGTAIGDILNGTFNPCGRLPVTFYKNTSQLPDVENYLMKDRTYRFFGGEPAYPFGYGLSYTQFVCGAPRLNTTTLGEGDTLNVNVTVTNSGQRDGAEVVQLYLRRPDDSDGPLKSLRGFARVNVKAGKSVTARINVPYGDFAWWDGATNTMRPLKGVYEVLVGPDSRAESLQKTTVTIK